MANIDKSQIKGWNSINMSYLSSFQSPYTQFKLDVLSIPIQVLYIHLCVMHNTLEMNLNDLPNHKFVKYSIAEPSLYIYILLYKHLLYAMHVYMDNGYFIMWPLRGI